MATSRTQTSTRTRRPVAVAGHPIQIDRSGQGHEGEIIDGGQSSCADYIASNGLHYRW